MKGFTLNQFFRVLAVFLLVTSTIVSILNFPVANAAVSDKCDGSSTQNNLKVTAQHGKIFYIDSAQGQNADAAYVSYAVTNTSASARKNIWVKLGSFTGGVVQLANSGQASIPVGDVSGSATGVAYSLLKAPNSSTRSQSHQVQVYLGNPNTEGATELYSCTFTFLKVMETIKARANKVSSISSTSASVVGSTFTITVEGNTGTMGAGNSLDGRSIWLSPASRSSWPTEAVRLESTTFSLYSNAGRNQLVSGYPKTDTLYYSIAAQDKYYYTAVYTFRIIGLAGSAVAIKPIGQISSGTQMKHNDISDSAIPETINLSTASVSMAITKALSTTAIYNATTNKLTYSYTVSLVNSGSSSQNVDLITDTPDSSITFVANSAQFNSVAISDPSASTVNSADLIFSGPFTIPANTTRTLTYQMAQRTGCTSGTYSYTNSATATLGQLIIGSGASTYSVVVGAGTCANTTITVTVTNPTLSPTAITNAASGITTTSANFNAQIDPNTQSGWTVSFEWGTTNSLTSTAITLADLTTNSSTAYVVSSSQTGLSTGTTYYYRIKLSKVGSTTVYGQIVSFTTSEPAADPTASTTNITNVSTSGSNVSVTFNGNIDPNQVTNGVKVRFEYAKRNSSSTTCTGNIDSTNYAPSSSTFVQIEDTNNTVDLVLSGSFSTNVEYLNSSSSNLVVLNTGASGFNTTNFCFRIVGLYNASSANWATAVNGDWVAFTASNKVAQTISYTQPSNMTVGGSSTSATATASSALSVTYESTDTSICTVDTSTGAITAITEGTCSLTATQAGNDSFYEATPVSVSFKVTAVLPTATTVSANSILTTSATINGTINGGGASTATTFCYGTDSNLTGCSSVTATQSPVTGASSTSVSYGLTGLSVGTTYYFRVSGTNSIGSTTGSILSFATKVPVTVNSAIGGSASSADASVSSGGNTTLTATASSGYTFTSWICTGGGTLSSATTNPTTLSNITTSATCIPTFTATSSGGGRNTSPGNTNSGSKKIVVERVSNQLNTEVASNQKPVLVGTNSTFTPGNSANKTESVSNSVSTLTSNSGGIVAVVTNTTSLQTLSSNSVEVSAANTNVQTSMTRNPNIPASVVVTRNEISGKISVTAFNGWTGRLSVAVVNESSGEEVDSYVEIVFAPTSISAPQIKLNPSVNPFAPTTPNTQVSPNTVNRPTFNSGQTITWQSPASEIIGYTVKVNQEVVCSTTATSCQPGLLIGPKSKVEIFAQGNDNTFSPSTQLPAFKPTRPIPALVVNFAVASPVLSNKFKTDLRNLATVMNKEGFTKVNISGHTDSTGQAVSYDNLRLSDARAKATMDYLKRFVPKLKAATTAVAYEKLIADESTPDGLYSNRRAEVSVW